MPDARPGSGAARAAVLAVAALLFLVPVAAGARAVADGWTPTGDQALFVLRVHDAADGHPPLVGMPSTASRPDEPVDHPGPLAFWVAAPGDWVAPANGAGAVLTFALINGVALAGTVLVARRIGGDGWALAVSATLAWFVLGLAGPLLYQPWNAHLAVLPGVLLLALTAAVVAGDRVLLPIQVGVASFVAQAHLAYLPVAGLLVATAVAATLWPGLAGRAPVDQGSDGPSGATDRRRGTRLERGTRGAPSARLWWTSAAVGLACWSGPLVQQVRDEPGNLWSILSAGTGSDEAVQGWSTAWRTLVATVGVPPRWLTGTAADVDRISAPGALASVVAAVVLAAAAWLAVDAWRAGRRLEVGVLATALASVLLGTAVVARLPADQLTVLSENSRRPLTAAGWWLWVGLGTAAVGAARRQAGLGSGIGTPSAATRAGPWAGAPATAVAAIAVVLLVAGAGAASVVRADPADAGGSVYFGAVRELSAAVPDEVVDGGVVAVSFEGASAGALTGPGLVAELVGRGATVSVPEADARAFGDRRRPDGPAAAELVVVSGDAAGEERPGHRLLATYDPVSPPARWEGFDRSVFLVPPEPVALYLRT